MNNDLKKSIALLERCYRLTTPEAPKSKSKRKPVVHSAYYLQRIDEIVAEVLAEEEAMNSEQC